MTCGMHALGKIPTWQQQPRFKVLGMVEQREVVVTEGNFWQHAPHLTSVKLSNRGLVKIPDLVFQLPKLKQLDLSRNAISVVPTNILNLSQLKVLDLSKNRLADFPFVPKSLEQLYLKGNQIQNTRNLSDSTLSVVDLSNNPLQNFDFSCFPEGAKVVTSP